MVERWRVFEGGVASAVVRGNFRGAVRVHSWHNTSEAAHICAAALNAAADNDDIARLAPAPQPCLADIDPSEGL